MKPGGVHGNAPIPHLPFAPLEKFARAPSIGVLAELLNVNPASVHRWRREGIRLDTAMDAADAVGGHPSEIWPFCDEIEPYWVTPPWFRRRRVQAVLASWRERLDCVGSAGDLARAMFNIESVA